jgi:hypothetical protein
MDVSGHLHAPAALTPGRELPVPIGQEAGWSPEPVYDEVVKRKIPNPCRDSNPDRLARSPALYPWAIPAPSEKVYTIKIPSVLWFWPNMNLAPSCTVVTHCLR